MLFVNCIIKCIRFLLILLQGLLTSYPTPVPPYTASKVSEAVLTTLYKEEQKLFFYLPNQPIAELKKLLDGGQFYPIYKQEFSYGKDYLYLKKIRIWSDQDWQDNHYRLIFGAKDETQLCLCEELRGQGAMMKYVKSKELSLDNDDLEDLFILCKNYKLYLEHRRPLDAIAKLLDDAKKVIKSFVVLNDGGIDYDKNFLKKKGNLNRLFTYAKFHQVIADQSLSCVRLPRKIIRFKNVNTDKYVLGTEAIKIIDDTLKVCLHQDATFAIKFISDEYKFEIFATREKTEGRGLSKKAAGQLKSLFEKAPFDVGDDNIFWDKHGNGIIIDTEYKDAQQTDLPKINRYPVDMSL